MKKNWIIILLILMSCGCVKDLISIDHQALDTKIEVVIDEVSDIGNNTIKIKSTLSGGAGQLINYVGNCWIETSQYSDVDPTINSNSQYIDYSSIVTGNEDVNGDGVINADDIFGDGGFIRRSYSTDINVHPDSVYHIRSFVIFNDTIINYSRLTSSYSRN